MASFGTQQLLPVLILITVYYGCGSDAFTDRRNGFISGRSANRDFSSRRKSTMETSWGSRRSTTTLETGASKATDSEHVTTTSTLFTSTKASIKNTRPKRRTGPKNQTLAIPHTPTSKESLEERRQSTREKQMMIFIAVIVAGAIVVAAVVIAVVLYGLYVCGWSPRFQRWVYTRQRRWQHQYHHTGTEQRDVYDYIDESGLIPSPTSSTAPLQYVRGSRPAAANGYVRVPEPNCPRPDIDVEYSTADGDGTIRTISQQQMPASDTPETPGSPYSTADSAVEIIRVSATANGTSAQHQPASDTPESPYSTADSAVEVIRVSSTVPVVDGEGEGPSCATKPEAERDLASHPDPMCPQTENSPQESEEDTTAGVNISGDSEPTVGGHNNPGQDTPDGATSAEIGLYAHLGQNPKSPDLTKTYDG